MVKCTVWGDFKADDVDGLHLSDELEELLHQSDINFVNFVAPIHSTGTCIRKSGPNISQSENAPQWLEDNGFNVVSLANNHIMDYGLNGMLETIDSFKTARVIGAGGWDDAYKMSVIKVNGLKIGILAGTQSEFGTLAEKNDKMGAAWCMSPEFESRILNRDVDYLIVINHGGIEYLDYPLPEWRDTYKKWIDMGADAVIASHPHVPQGWELYKGKTICYSLGNFCFQTDRQGRPHWNESLCCILEFDDDREMRITMRPVSYDVHSRCIGDNKAVCFETHLAEMNQVLNSDSEYMCQINKAVLKLLPLYYGLFSRSGFLHPVKSTGLLKGFVERFKKEHIYNCMKCESHRWAITRAMQLKYGLDRR